MQTTTASAVQPTADLPPAPVTFTAKAVEMVQSAIAQENLQGYGIRVGRHLTQLRLARAGDDDRLHRVTITGGSRCAAAGPRAAPRRG